MDRAHYREAGIRPELEVFDLGHVALAARMVSQGAFEGKPVVKVCRGIS